MASIFKFATNAHKWWFCKISRSYRHSSRSSKPSLYYPDTFLNYLDTFRIVRKLSRSPRHISRSSGLSLDYLDIFLNYLDTFRIVRKLSRSPQHIFRSSGHFLSLFQFLDFSLHLLDGGSPLLFVEEEYFPPARLPG